MTMFHYFESDNLTLTFILGWNFFHSKSVCPAFHSLYSFLSEFPLFPLYCHLDTTLLSFSSFQTWEILKIILLYLFL